MSVEGDHLLLKDEHGSRTLIPMSATEFLSFRADDLAQYQKVTFHVEADGRMSVSVADAAGS